MTTSAVVICEKCDAKTTIDVAIAVVTGAAAVAPLHRGHHHPLALATNAAGAAHGSVLVKCCSCPHVMSVPIAATLSLAVAKPAAIRGVARSSRVVHVAQPPRTEAAPPSGKLPPGHCLYCKRKSRGGVWCSSKCEVAYHRAQAHQKRPA